MNKKKRLRILTFLIAHFSFLILSFLILSCGNPLILYLLDPKTVSFETNSDDRVDSQTVFRDHPVKRPPDPSKDGYTFDAWYTSNDTFSEEERWNFDDIPTASFTLYANWYPVGGTGGTIINDVAITVTGPVKGEKPDTEVSDTEIFKVSEVTWEPDDNPFQGGKVYTLYVTLTARNGYTFAILFTATINDNEATVTDNNGSEVTFFLPFDKTFVNDVTGISIKTQPTNLSYTHGDTLDLSGLEVTLKFDDGSSRDFLFDNFGTNITAKPANGAVLSRSANDGKSVVVFFGNSTANTDPLTVNAKDLPSPNPIPAQTYTGSSLTPAVTIMDGTTTLTLNTDYTMSYTDNTNAGTAVINIVGRGNYTGSHSVNFTIVKADGAPVSAPTAAAIDVDSVTLNPVPVPANGQTVEYARNTTNTAPTSISSWQYSTTFNNLTDGTTYYFFARSVANDNYNAGAASTGTMIATHIYNNLNVWQTATAPNFTTASYDHFMGIAYGNNRFVAVGFYNDPNTPVNRDGKMAYSDDGENWTAVANSTFGTSDIYGIAYGGGRFVAVGDNGKIAHSTDGENWTATTVTDPQFGTPLLFAIAYGGGKFVAVGAVGKIATSTDGITWTSVGSTTEEFTGIAHNGDTGTGCFVIVGSSGIIRPANNTLTSFGGVSGEESTFGTSTIRAVAYGDSKFVAVGDGGKMAYSADGENWTAVVDSTFGTSDIFAITHGNNRFVAGGAGGKMAYSSDGVTWTAVTDSTFGAIRINGIAYGNNKFVAVGNSCKIGVCTP